MPRVVSSSAQKRAAIIVGGSCAGLVLALLVTGAFLEWSERFGPTTRTYLQVTFFLVAPMLVALLAWIISREAFVACALIVSLGIAVVGAEDNLDVYAAPTFTDFVVQALVFFTMGAFLPLAVTLGGLLGEQHKDRTREGAHGQRGVQ